MPPGAENGVAPLASSVDIGWNDGKPRSLQPETKNYLAGKQVAPELQPVQRKGWAPRPRSKNAPKPAKLVSYGDNLGEVRRATMDNTDVDELSMEELILQNAESVKQFEYLEKSLVTFQNAVSFQAAELRQPIVREREVVADLGDALDEDAVEHHKQKQEAAKKGGVGAKASAVRQGAPPIFHDVLVGRSDAMNPLSNIYAEGDTPYADKHLQPLDPIIVEGEGYLYGIRSIQIVALKEQVRGNDFINCYSGSNHSMGLTAAGPCYTWGANTMHQLGYQGAEQGVLGLDMEPRLVEKLHGEVVVAGSCGKLHTVVFTEDGQVFSWGAYSHGQLGIGDVSQVQHPFGWCPPTKIKSLDKNIRTVACGHFHTVMIDSMGDIWSCGSKEHGAHGQNSVWDVTTPAVIAKIHGHDFRQVACGAMHTIALTADGKLWAWGLNEDGQLGLGHTNETSVQGPMEIDAVSGRNIRKIACGNAHSMFLSDRDVYTFGSGNSGALGHGNSKSYFLPKQVVKLTEDARLRDISAGPQFSVALSDLGQLFFWGNMRSTAGRGANKTVYNMPRRFKGLEAIFSVACGEHEITALVRIPVAPPLEHKFRASMFVEDGETGVVNGYIGRACTWGRASNGKLGHGAGKAATSDLKTPFAIYGPLYYFSITVVSCGCEHSACITDNGRLFTWGSNKEGQLGIGATSGFFGVGGTASRSQPTIIEYCRDPDEWRLKKASNKKFRDVVCGMWHCLAITTKKKVYAWGKNKYGQLGLGHTNNEATPCSILPLSDPFLHKHVRAIGAGKSHSAVVVEDGDVFTWGRGWDGQLGHEAVTEIELEPRIVPKMQDKSAQAVACGRAHTVVLTDNGQVYSWGENSSGQLGHGDLKLSSEPRVIRDLEESEVTLIACGDEHTVCVTITNEVYGFGNGVYDQLGLGTLGIFPNPQRIPGLTAVPRIKQLECGNYSTGVVSNDDNCYLIGLWDGVTQKALTSTARSAPVAKSAKGTTPDALEVPLGIMSVRRLALGENHGIVIGFEEDRQHLIQERLQEERQEMHAGQMSNDNVVALKAGGQDLVKRELVVPYVKQDHGGEPFPDEIDDPKMHYGEEEVGDALRNQIEPGDEGGGAGGGDALDGNGEGDDDDASVAASSLAADKREMEAIEPAAAAPNSKGYLVVWGNNQHHQLGACLSIEKQLAKEKVLPKNVKPIHVHKDKVAVPPTLIGPDALGAGVKLPSISNVACGEYHTLAVAQDGTLWSWGLNSEGQLGHGITKAGDFKTHLLPKRVQGLEKKIVIKAAAGGQFSVVLTESNKVYAWGSNKFGQLGTGKKELKNSTPDIVGTLRRSGTCHIVCGYSHCVALLKTEQLFAWGRNDSGQLGLGHYDDVSIPEHITAFKKVQVQQIQCGYDHCVAFVAEDGGLGAPPVEKIFTWGRGEEGQLGHEDKYSRCVPKMVSTLNSRGVRLVAAGGFSSAAIDEVKQVYTWGDGRNGQLGHGDFIDLTCPQIVKQPVDEDDEAPDHLGTFRARSIHLGPNYMLSMGLDAEQEKRADPQYADQLAKYSWGSNKFGTLGMPYLNAKKRKQGAEKTVPEKIPFLTFHNVKEIACGLEHVVAVVEVQSLTEDEIRRRKAEGLDKDSDGPLERLLNDLKQLGDGELETAADPDAEGEGAGAMMVGKKGAGAMDGEDAAEEEDEETRQMKDKLCHPRQIYDRLHSVEPLVTRLGLPEKVTRIFSEDESMDFDTFLRLGEQELLDMGVESFGARRRLLRVIQELNQAPMLAAEDAEQDFEMKLPAYTNEERKYKGVAQHEFQCHVADFLDTEEYEDLDQAKEEGEDVMYNNNQAFGFDKDGRKVTLVMRDDFVRDRLGGIDEDAEEDDLGDDSGGFIQPPPQPAATTAEPGISMDFSGLNFLGR